VSNFITLNLDSIFAIGFNIVILSMNMRMFYLLRTFYFFLQWIYILSLNNLHVLAAHLVCIHIELKLIIWKIVFSIFLYFSFFSKSFRGSLIFHSFLILRRNSLHSTKNVFMAISESHLEILILLFLLLTVFFNYHSQIEEPLVPSLLFSYLEICFNSKWNRFLKIIYIIYNIYILVRFRILKGIKYICVCVSVYKNCYNI